MGFPETLPEWVKYNGLSHIKIKLNGEDIKWDVDRVLRVDKAAPDGASISPSISTRSARTSATSST